MPTNDTKTDEGSENEQMEVRNYTYLDEGLIIDSNGSKFAVGVDDSGYLTILNGEITHIEEETFFWAYDSEKQGYKQLPKNELLDAISKL